MNTKRKGFPDRTDIPECNYTKVTLSNPSFFKCDVYRNNKLYAKVKCNSLSALFKKAEKFNFGYSGK